MLREFRRIPSRTMASSASVAEIGKYVTKKKWRGKSYVTIAKNWASQGAGVT
jgi:hypothetical protein